jgi:hypothetical protein
LLNLCISSTKSIVCLPILFKLLASKNILFNSATPENTAEQETNSASTYSAINFATVVLPQPGGHQNIIDLILPVSNCFDIIPFLPKICSCPTIFSSLSALTYSARGTPFLLSKDLVFKTLFILVS